MADKRKQALKNLLKESYTSKTEPRVHYRSMVPGHKTTPGRLEYEGHIIRERRKKLKRLGRKRT